MRAHEKTLQAGTYVAKSDNLGLIPKTYMAGEPTPACCLHIHTLLLPNNK